MGCSFTDAVISLLRSHFLLQEIFLEGGIIHLKTFSVEMIYELHFMYTSYLNVLLSINRPHSTLPLEKKILWTTERSSNEMLKVFFVKHKNEKHRLRDAHLSKLLSK